ncbi:hypothetical protein DASC09_040080 [Saccharomycopsis crataegensis]|uniref:DUF3533 domain-containing protein n=1 Tax=Saccharomycopsis crataegensis TaxID=43959 RepID=A0AAV5QPH4_9ASCO|nr:hypothetical protein DASC09_040080 [Saccharomycopsis crataegensis]
MPVSSISSSQQQQQHNDDDANHQEAFTNNGAGSLSPSSTSSSDHFEDPAPYVVSPEGERSGVTRGRRGSLMSIFSQEMSNKDLHDEKDELSGYHGSDIMGAIQLTRTLGGDQFQDDEEAVLLKLESVASHLSQTLNLHDNKDNQGKEEEQESKQQAIEKLPELTKKETIMDTIKRNFWDPDFREERVKQFYRLGLLLILITILFMGVVSIYTGSYYSRNKRYNNLKFYIVNEDATEGQLPGLIGAATQAVGSSLKQQGYGNWEVYNMTQFMQEAQKKNKTVQEEIVWKLYHEKCWGIAHVGPNATLGLYQAILTGNTSYNLSQSGVTLYYETARDYMAVTLYIRTLLAGFEKGFYTAIPKALYNPLVSQIFTTSQLSAITNNTASIDLLMNPPPVTLYDTVPVTSTMILPALQLGMVYILIFAFFSFLVSLKIHIFVSRKVKGVHFLLYRFINTQITYLILGLAYSSLNAMFGVPYDAAFGKSGFLVLWFITYLAINAVGTTNELMALYCFTFFPPMVGPWVLLWTVINISPTFSIIELCPTFYRYGYAVPIHNLYEVLKVIFCDRWKGHMGRNIGVLVIWAVIGNLLLPIVQTLVARKMKKKAQAAAAKEQEEKRGETDSDVKEKANLKKGEEVADSESQNDSGSTRDQSSDEVTRLSRNE